MIHVIITLGNMAVILNVGENQELDNIKDN